MEEHTKIIELYGLPGCGKTTLKRNLIEKNPTCFCGMDDVTSRYKSSSFFTKCRCLPVSSIWALLKLFVVFPVLKITDWNIYKGFFSLLVVYNYCKVVKVSDYVIIDHGLVQSCVSLLYSVHLDNKQIYQYQQRFTSFLKSVGVDLFSYCSIPILISLNRVRTRNRMNSGRLDAIYDDDELIKALSREGCFFDRFYTLLQSTSQLGLKIDMTKSVDKSSELLLCSLNNYENVK